MSNTNRKIWAYRRENGRVGVRNYVAILPVDDISNAACEAVARTAGRPYIPLGVAGHVCALEAAEAVNRLLSETPSGDTA